MRWLGVIRPYYRPLNHDLSRKKETRGWWENSPSHIRYFLFGGETYLWPLMSACWSVDRSVCWSVCHYFLKGREVTLLLLISEHFRLSLFGALVYNLSEAESLLVALTTWYMYIHTYFLILWVQPPYNIIFWIVYFVTVTSIERHKPPVCWPCFILSPLV